MKANVMAVMVANETIFNEWPMASINDIFNN